MQIAMTQENANQQSALACDCHFHVFNASEGAAGARYVPAYTSTLDDWASAARPCGVTRGVIVQPSFLGTDNSRMLAAIAQQPHALRGVAVVAPEVTVPELQALHASGVRGVRLNLSGVRDDVAAMRDISPQWWSALFEANLHLELHTDVGRVAALLPFVPRDITVVLDHFGKPELISSNDATITAVCARNALGGATYVTLSGAYRQSVPNTPRCAEIATLWRDEVGIERLLWGSDWPCTNHEHAANYAALFDALRAWLPGTGERHAALTANANSIYWR